jgi:hypothetical protein
MKIPEGALSGCLSFTKRKPLNSCGFSYAVASVWMYQEGSWMTAPWGKWSPLLNVWPPGVMTFRPAKAAPMGWRRWDSWMKLG